MDNLFQLDRALTPEERRRLNAKPRTKKTGHAWRPGTGPQGETCKTCKNLVRKQMSKVYLKCGLMRAQWTCGGGTDVRASDPACREWAALVTKPPCAHEAIIGLDGKWHCQRCGDAIEMAVAHTNGDLGTEA